MPFEITELRLNTIQYLYSRRAEIDMDPPISASGGNLDG